MAATGRLASLATSYDIAFLHLVLAALENAPTRRLPCTALPFKKVEVRQLSEASQRWLAAVNLLLMEAKCRDDVADERGWKGRLGLSLLSRRSRWAREVAAETDFSPTVIAELPERQAEAETVAVKRGSTLEALALPTSLMLGEVFAHLAALVQRPETTIPLRQLGQALGAAIYFKDAWDDRETDRKRGSFNAIEVCLAKQTSYSATVDAMVSRELRRAAAGLDGLDLQADGPALEAIVMSLRPRTAGAENVLSRWRQRQQVRGVFELCAVLGACGPPCLEACGAGCGAGGGACPSSGCCCPTDSKSQAVKMPDMSAPLVKAKPGLLCPSCGHQMLEVGAVAPGVDLDECTVCFGLWLDKGELEAIAAAASVPERLLTPKTVPPSVQPRPEGTRPCPRCARMLTVTTIKGTRIDLCQSCKGLFLDQGELNGLLD